MKPMPERVTVSEAPIILCPIGRVTRREVTKWGGVRVRISIHNRPPFSPIVLLVSYSLYVCLSVCLSASPHISNCVLYGVNTLSTTVVLTSAGEPKSKSSS